MNIQAVRNLIFAFVVISCISIHAEEAGFLTRAMNDGPKDQKVKSVESDSSAKNEKVFDRQEKPMKGIEFRIGPIYNYTDNINIQTGPRGQGFDLKKMGLDDPNLGVKADLDWQMNDQLHFLNGFTWIHFNQTGTLDSNVTYGSGMKLLKGSRVKSELDIVKYEPKIGYDVVKTEDFRLMPYGGFIAGISTGDVSALSGQIEREKAPKTGVAKVSTIDKAKVYDTTELFATYILGFQTEYRFTSQFYTGCDLGGYYLGFLYGASGKGYFAYDFNEKLSMRLGCDVDWASYDERHLRFDGYTATPYVQLGVKF